MPRSSAATILLPKGVPAISEPTDLGDDFEIYLAELVRSGRYGSRDEALRDGVRLLQQRDATIAEMRMKYLQGVAAADRGDHQAAADVLTELRNNVAAMKLGRGTRN